MLFLQCNMYSVGTSEMERGYPYGFGEVAHGGAQERNCYGLTASSQNSYVEVLVYI